MQGWYWVDSITNNSAMVVIFVIIVVMVVIVVILVMVVLGKWDAPTNLWTNHHRTLLFPLMLASPDHRRLSIDLGS